MNNLLKEKGAGAKTETKVSLQEKARERLPEYKPLARFQALVSLSPIRLMGDKFQQR